MLLYLQNQSEIRKVLGGNRGRRSNSSSSPSAAAPRKHGHSHGTSPHSVLSAWEQQQKQQQRLLLEWSRQDPLRVRTMLQQQHKTELERQQQRGVLQDQLLMPQKNIDFPRLFGFTDLLLLPFDMEGDLRVGAAASDTAGETAGGATGGAAASGGLAEAGGFGSNVDMSGSSCSSEWLYVGGEALLHAGEVQELQQLLCSIIGVSPLFSAPVDPNTHENALYTGDHYSLAFLIEAALKDKVRQVDAAYHTPWDEEVSSKLVRDLGASLPSV